MKQLKAVLYCVVCSVGLRLFRIKWWRKDALTLNVD